MEKCKYSEIKSYVGAHLPELMRVVSEFLGYVVAHIVAIIEQVSEWHDAGDTWLEQRASLVT